MKDGIWPSSAAARDPGERFGTADPEAPVSPEQFIDRSSPEELQEPAGSGVVRGSVALAVLLAAVAAWIWSPADQWFNADAINRAGDWLEKSEAAPLALIGAFLAAGFIAAPITPLVVVGVLAFDLAAGFAYSISGALLSAILTYGIGCGLGRGGVRRLAGQRLNRLSRQLARRGFLAILAVRIVPVAPFTVINLVAGASHIRFRDFALASALGMAPGMLLVAVLVDRLEASVREPALSSLFAAVVAAAVLAVIVFAARRWFAGKRAKAC